MYTRAVGQIIVLAIAVTVVCASANAQQTVYKWTDEDGVVHFSDSPPAKSETAGVETVAIPKAPPAPPAIQSTTSVPAPARPSNEASSIPVKTAAPTPARTLDITTMSLGDLDLRCEVARERKIAPLRSARRSGDCSRTSVLPRNRTRHARLRRPHHLQPARMTP